MRGVVVVECRFASPPRLRRGRSRSGGSAFGARNRDGVRFALPAFHAVRERAAVELVHRLLPSPPLFQEYFGLTGSGPRQLSLLAERE